MTFLFSTITRKRFNFSTTEWTLQTTLFYCNPNECLTFGTRLKSSTKLQWRLLHSDRESFEAGHPISLSVSGCPLVCLSVIDSRFWYPLSDQRTLPCQLTFCCQFLFICLYFFHCIYLRLVYARHTNFYFTVKPGQNVLVNVQLNLLLTL